MALNACVKAVLCGLGNAALQAFQGVIAAQRAVLQGYIATLQAQLVVLDIAVAPLRAVEGVVRSAAAEVESTAALVPLALIAECADLGQVNLDLFASVEPVVNDVLGVLEELQRLLSFRDEISALIVAVQAEIDRFLDLELVIAECAQVAP